jgi:hypothetical protein
MLALLKSLPTPLLSPSASSSSDRRPLRLLASGSEFQEDLRQLHTLRGLSVLPNVPGSGPQEVDHLFRGLWEAYLPLGVPIRGVRVPASQLGIREMARSEIQVWIPSQREWTPTSRITHYGDHLSRRLALEDVLLVETVALDSRQLMAGILENLQTAHGGLVIPECVQSFVL